MTRSEHGAELKRSYNCCQAVLLAYADLLPLSEAQLLALGSTFGSGMGGVKGTCGASRLVMPFRVLSCLTHE